MDNLKFTKEKPSRISQSSPSFMYNNCQTHGEDLEDAFSHSEILYLIEYSNNKKSKSSKQKPGRNQGLSLFSY